MSFGLAFALAISLTIPLKRCAAEQAQRRKDACFHVHLQRCELLSASLENGLLTPLALQRSSSHPIGSPPAVVTDAEVEARMATATEIKELFEGAKLTGRDFIGIEQDEGGGWRFVVSAEANARWPDG